MLGIPFIGFLYREKDLLEAAIKELTQIFKSTYITTEELDFTLTTFYEDEMGGNLKRVWCAFDTFIPVERLLEIKLLTMELEQKYSQNSKRKINIDPGVIQLNKVLLSTHKDAPHRIYLGHGIYIENTLIYHHKSFNPLPWTYQDYRWKEAVEYFNSLRDKIRSELKNVSDISLEKF